jgi:hypothetical protein
MPLKKHIRETPFNQIEIAIHINWQSLILRQLKHYEKSAPYYSDVISFVCDCFAQSEANLARFNTILFRKACQYLGIAKPIYLLSELDLELGPINGPGDWGLQIAKAIGAEEFINPIGGIEILNENYYREHGVRLIFQAYEHMIYDCKKYQFEPGLSILDVMMWNSSEAIKQHLDHQIYSDAFREIRPLCLNIKHDQMAQS